LPCAIELLNNRKKNIAPGVQEAVREKRVTKRLLRSLYHAENSEPEFLVHWPANVPVNCPRRTKLLSDIRWAKASRERCQYVRTQATAVVQSGRKGEDSMKRKKWTEPRNKTCLCVCVFCFLDPHAADLEARVAALATDCNKLQQHHNLVLSLEAVLNFWNQQGEIGH
jgi:hypothetical protein